MQVNGVVISAELDVQVAKKDGGSYPGARLAYRDDTGTMREQNFHNNTFKFNAPLKAQIGNLKAGDKIVITKEKEGEFWNVKAINLQGQVQPQADKDTPATGKTTPYASPKSTYETSEERAKKQVYIVRQSSITAALKFAELFKVKVSSVADLVPYAKAFEDYVFGTTNQFNPEELQGDEDMVL